MPSTSGTRARQSATPKSSKTCRYSCPRSTIAPKPARNVIRGMPSTSAQTDQMRVSSMSVSPTSRQTQRSIERSFIADARASAGGRFRALGILLPLVRERESLLRIPLGQEEHPIPGEHGEWLAHVREWHHEDLV